MKTEMKDSGVAWIGEIPKHWNTVKLGDLYSQRKEKVSDKDFPPLSVTMQGILPQLETAAKTDDGDNRKLVRIGDFAINSRSDRRGSCGISSYDGSVSLINTVLVPRNEMNPNFYNWLFHTSLFADEYYKWGHGIVDDLWTTKWQEMKNIFVVAPDLEEQSRIANFLDKKCAEIDELIALQEQMIAQLTTYKQAVITETVTKGLDPNVKMKDSGVEWIGEIPEHWEIRRIKNEAMLNPSITISIPNDDVMVSYMPMECLRNGTIKPNIGKYSDVRNYTPFQEEDLVIAKVTPCFENGNIAVARNLENKVGFGSSEIFVLRCKESMENDFLFYYLQSPYVKNMGIASMTGTGGLKRVNPNVLNSMFLVYPPLSEQQSIANYLDKKCKEIDELISIKKEKIEQLKAYKKSVIYEYVTGKKQVEIDNSVHTN